MTPFHGGLHGMKTCAGAEGVASVPPVVQAPLPYPDGPKTQLQHWHYAEQHAIGQQEGGRSKVACAVKRSELLTLQQAEARMPQPCQGLQMGQDSVKGPATGHWQMASQQHIDEFRPAKQVPAKRWASNTAGSASFAQHAAADAMLSTSTRQETMELPGGAHNSAPRASARQALGFEQPAGHQAGSEIADAQQLCPFGSTRQPHVQSVAATGIDQEFGSFLTGPILRDDMMPDPMQIDAEIMGLDADLATAWHHNEADNMRQDAPF
jgi:hypothetical protein